ncbi:unnamed protein product [Cladocopium goreaui]|uniref:ATP-dependent Clp protease ATP-binding subunit clpA-like n=1 Tax=Cladocopium goreaui TaxID=2562237 RepID=A0A9P1D9E5_9DINO|nr:unnamed protein product [Cladocopium goreaui]
MITSSRVNDFRVSAMSIQHSGSGSVRTSSLGYHFSAMAAVETVCSRCQGKGHRAADCHLPFFRSCQYCKTPGHTAKECPLLRHCTYCKCEGHTNRNCAKLLAKRAKARASDDSKSETSEASNGQSGVSTASTWASSPPKKHWKQWTEPQKRWMQALTEDEEKQARKVEKKLREIAALEARLAEGETLEDLQQKKVDKKSEFEDCEVMRKLRSGYRRCELPAKSLMRQSNAQVCPGVSDMS